ncbi:MAG: family 16 glycoside hydrolase [Pirellulales bacterium]
MDRPSVASPTSSLRRPEIGTALTQPSITLVARPVWAILILLVSLASAPLDPRELGAAEPVEFQSIFDGRTFDGWETPDRSYWTIVDGALTATISREHPCDVNQYLVWTGGQLSDFELKLESRVRGEGGINNGFQFRSRLLPDHDVCGYQVDNNLQTPWLVRLYDEFGRHTLAMRGEASRIDPDGTTHTEPLADAAGPAWFQLDDWHEYHLICRGPQIELKVDGRPAAKVTDNDKYRAEPMGILALQLHSGPPTVAQFRNIRLKLLTPTQPLTSPRPELPPAVAALRKDATAWWEMETGGHGAAPPLKHFPAWDQFELNVCPSGPGARPDTKIVRVHGARFEASGQLIDSQRPLTVMMRAASSPDVHDRVLFSQLDPQGAVRVRLAMQPAAGTTGPRMCWEVRTDRGLASACWELTADAASAWHDWVASYDGGQLVLACDGQVVARTAHAGTLVPAADRLIIGGQPMGDQVDRLFQGEIETVAIWPRALSAAEIAQLSAAGSQ